MKDMLKKQLLDLFMNILDSGERRYIATMENINGDKITVGVTAYSTEDAMRSIEDSTINCTLLKIRVIDEDGNIF